MSVCFPFPIKANLAPTTHIPSHEACRPIVGRVLALLIDTLEKKGLDTIVTFSTGQRDKKGLDTTDR